MPYKMAPGPALRVPGDGPSEGPGSPLGPVVKVPRPVAARARYVGDMRWTQEYGVLAVFVDPETGLRYAQPAGE